MSMNAIRLTFILLLWSSLASAQERNTDAGANAQPEQPGSVSAPPPARNVARASPRRPTPRSFTPSETVSADAEVRFPVDI